MTPANTGLTQDVQNFANQCVFMRSIYLHHRVLFAASSPEEKDLMSRTANIFFWDLNEVLIEYITLQVCKITDPAKHARNRENLTVSFLLQRYDFGAEPTKVRHLTELHDKLLAFGAKLRPARNKFISHSDRTAIAAGVPLGAASESEWTQFWLDLQHFVAAVYEKAVGVTLYINGVAMASDASSLLQALKCSSFCN